MTGPVLGISASRKRADPSASRALLEFALDQLANRYPAELLDLRTLDVPHFEGRPPSQLGGDVAKVTDAVNAAGAVLFSVPCYWSAPSGVFKNLIDVLCGPAYDLSPPTTVFSGKPAGMIVVGADTRSAREGSECAVRVLDSIGAELVAPPVIVSDPRGDRVDQGLARALIECAVAAAKAAISSPGSPT